jgi:cytochrome c biogenesis protein CcmG/thiol:disulfide interchange protein DsbE
MSENTNSSAAPKRSVPVWAQILIWVGLLGLLAILALGLKNVQRPIIAVGSPAPDFTLTFFDGYGYNGAKQVKLSDLYDKVVLVNFWASWCKPCEQEAPDLEAAWQSYQQSGQVVFLGVDYVDTEPEARSYLAKFGITFPNGPDLATRISQSFNRNMGVPETYIVDRLGVLRYIQIGPFQSVAEIQAIIGPLLGGK